MGVFKKQGVFWLDYYGRAIANGNASALISAWPRQYTASAKSRLQKGNFLRRGGQ
jgi:hypothetical protein